MTLLQAKNLASDLIDAGCEVTAREIAVGSENWEVIAIRPFDHPSASAVATFATNRSVSATVKEARFF